MSTKTQPLGICDHCLGPIPRDEWYTSHGKPRLHCSRDCRNTANSRAGAPIRSRKARQRVANGAWVNPLILESPAARREHARHAATTGRTREVEQGTWRNPALDDSARAKLSRPRVHTADPLVHRAFEMMRHGVRCRDLPADALAAYREYRRQQSRTRGDALRAYQRARYRRQQAAMTDAQREQQRAKWRAANHRRRTL